jgi:hypothetical protein
VSQSPWQSVPHASALLSCAVCGTVVPMTQAQQIHLRWHARMARLEARVAAVERMVAVLHLAAEEEASDG